MLAQAIRAATLHRHAYSKIDTNQDAILHALGTVIVCGISISLGLMSIYLDFTEPDLSLDKFFDRLVVIWLWIMTAMVGWIIWGATVYIFGSKFLRGKASYRTVLRALGICYGPTIFLMFITVPIIGIPASIIGTIWVLLAGTVAVREIQNLDWIGTTLTTIPGWIVSFILIPLTVLGSLS